MNVLVAISVVTVFCSSLNMFSSENMSTNCKIECSQLKTTKTGAFGREKPLEDRFKICVTDKGVFGAVYDGHCGIEAVEVLQNHLHTEFLSFLKENNAVKEAFEHAFESVEKKLFELYRETKIKCNSHTSFGGSTASCFYIDKEKMIFYSGHVGDSRVAIGVNDELIFCTKDHKPNDEGEKSRIENAGGEIIERNSLPGVFTVNNLCVSRVFADFDLKNTLKNSLKDHTMEGDGQIIAQCEFSVRSLLGYDKDAKIVIVAFSDGVVDGKLSNEDIIKIPSASEIAQQARRQKSEDDITALRLTFTLNSLVSLPQGEWQSTGQATDQATGESTGELNGSGSKMVGVNSKGSEIIKESDQSTGWSSCIIGVSVLVMIVAYSAFYYYKTLKAR